MNITRIERNVIEKRGRGVEFTSARVWGTLEDDREFNFAVAESEIEDEADLLAKVAEFVTAIQPQHAGA